MHEAEIRSEAIAHIAHEINRVELLSLANGLGLKLDNNPIYFPEFFLPSVDAAIDNLSKSSPELIENYHLIDKSEREIRVDVIHDAELTLESGEFYDVKTTLKRLTKARRKTIEAIALHAGIVGGQYGRKRCTNFAMWNRKDKLKAQDDWAKNTVITNGINSFSLADAGQTRKKKLNKLYVIAKGIEKLGESDGMAWASVVCTVPPEMHPNPSRGRKTWDGTLPNESAYWLQNQWAKVRADLGNDEIVLSGIWTREAHSDATPHMNFLIYFHSENKHQVEETFKTYFAHSKKAMKWRSGGDVADGEAKASFASYALKYFAKFLSADEVQSDESVCEEAWASAFSLRRYGFFGIPSLQQWDRLRAQRSTPHSTDPIILKSWRAARANDAATWIALSGGLGAKGKDRPLETIQQISVSGKSKIAVGVFNRLTRASLITKIVGEWTIKALKTAISEVKQVAEKTENQLVTLALSYPSKTQTPFKTIAEFQKRRDILHSPMLIH